MDIDHMIANAAYLMALNDKSFDMRITKKIVLPDLFSTDLIQKLYLNDRQQLNLDSIIEDTLGYQLFKLFADNESHYRFYLDFIELYFKINCYYREKCKYVKSLLLTEIKNMSRTLNWSSLTQTEDAEINSKYIIDENLLENNDIDKIKTTETIRNENNNGNRSIRIQSADNSKEKRNRVVFGSDTAAKSNLRCMKENFPTNNQEKKKNDKHPIGNNNSDFFVRFSFGDGDEYKDSKANSHSCQRIENTTSSTDILNVCKNQDKNSSTDILDPNRNITSSTDLLDAKINKMTNSNKPLDSNSNKDGTNSTELLNTNFTEHQLKSKEISVNNIKNDGTNNESVNLSPIENKERAESISIPVCNESMEKFSNSESLRKSENIPPKDSFLSENLPPQASLVTNDHSTQGIATDNCKYQRFSTDDCNNRGIDNEDGTADVRASGGKLANFINSSASNCNREDNLIIKSSKEKKIYHGKHSLNARVVSAEVTGTTSSTKNDKINESNDGIDFNTSTERGLNSKFNAPNYEYFYDQNATLLDANIPTKINKKLEKKIKTIQSYLSQFLISKLFKEFKESIYFYCFLQWIGCEYQMKIEMTCFNIHRIIGRGGFGEVYGCHKNDTGKLFAVKLLDKRSLKYGKSISFALREVDILAKMDNPFIVRLYYCFDTSDKVAIFLDLLDGGDLMYHLKHHKNFSEAEMKFYICEIIMGLEYLHSNGIMYRDLKPANCLLERSGHLRLSDLGLAYDYTEKLPTRYAGTRGFSAPELEKDKQPYGPVSDYYSLGCLIREMMTYQERIETMKIKKCKIERILHPSPELIDEEFKNIASNTFLDMIKRLLEIEPEKRLGYAINPKTKIPVCGAHLVMKHEFLRDVDWFEVFQKKLEPPIVPPSNEINAANAFSIGNFDDKNTKNIKLTAEDEKKFKKFKFFGKESWRSEILTTVFDKYTETLIQSQTEEFGEYQNYLEIIQNGNCKLFGYLMKKSKKLFRSWQRVFLEIHPEKIVYGPNHKNIKESICISHIESVQVIHPKTYIFELKLVDNKRIAFKAAFHKQLKLWIEQIRVAKENTLLLTESELQDANNVSMDELRLPNYKKVLNRTRSSCNEPKKNPFKNLKESLIRKFF